MNQHNRLYSLVKKMVFAIFLSMIIFGCTKNSKQRAIGFSEEVVSEQSVIEESPIGDTIIEDNDKDVLVVKDGPEGNKPKKGDLCFAPAPGSNKANKAGSDKANPADSDKANLENLDKYISLLEVDKKIKLKEEGTALVWIGLEEQLPSQDEDVTRDSSPVYLNSGVFARITLNADKCEIINDNPVVIPIEATGSSFRFSIMPKEKGNINVYANIDFFSDQACTIGPIKKAATKRLHVKVRISYLDEIWNDVWNGFSIFFVSLVALFFGALLFVIRRFIKNKTGYDEEEQKQIFNKKRIGSAVKKEAEVEIKEEDGEEIEELVDQENDQFEQETLPADE